MSTITLNIPSHLADLEVGRRAANRAAKNAAAKSGTTYTTISLPEALNAAGITLVPAEAQLLLTRTSVELAEAAAEKVAAKVRTHVVASTPKAKPTPKVRATGVGSRGGDPRKALARLQSLDAGAMFSPEQKAAYKLALAKAEKLSVPQVHRALVKLGAKVAK